MGQYKGRYGIFVSYGPYELLESNVAHQVIEKLLIKEFFKNLLEILYKFVFLHLNTPKRILKKKL